MPPLNFLPIYSVLALHPTAAPAVASSSVIRADHLGSDGLRLGDRSSVMPMTPVARKRAAYASSTLRCGSSSMRHSSITPIIFLPKPSGIDLDECGDDLTTLLQIIHQTAGAPPERYGVSLGWMAAIIRGNPRSSLFPILSRRSVHPIMRQCAAVDIRFAHYVGHGWLLKFFCCISRTKACRSSFFVRRMRFYPPLLPWYPLHSYCFFRSISVICILTNT